VRRYINYFIPSLIYWIERDFVICFSPESDTLKQYPFRRHEEFVTIRITNHKGQHVHKQWLNVTCTGRAQVTSQILPEEKTPLLLLGLEVVEKDGTLLRLLTPVTNDDARAVDDLAGVAFPVKLAWSTN